MAKQWKCKSCGAYVSKGVLASVRGGPEQCEQCGGTEFESPIVSGPVDSVLDRLT
jgi:predicted nucleic-acid-binding Zn-ribbon protein